MQETIPKILISDPTNYLTIVEHPETNSHQCKICGASALHINYGAMTCCSCQIFFRRNAAKEQEKSLCQYGGHCEININNRHICSSCRRAKCFGCGMRSDLIRCTRSKKNISSEIIMAIGKKDKQQRLLTLNILQSDNSTLDSSQWTRLSNLVYSYDENQLLSIAHRFINESNVLETLIIIDPILPKEFFIEVYETSRRYLQSNGDLCTLSSDDRSAFLRNAADSVTCLGAMFSWRWSQLDNFRPFIQVFGQIYGDSSLPLIQHVLKFMDSDIVIAKLALSLFAFSNNISMFSPHSTTKSINTLAVFHIQNIYAEVLWKYLLYKYGYYQSIQRFINLIQCLSAAIDTVFDAQDIEKHVNDIESLIEKIELTLVLDDMEHID